MADTKNNTDAAVEENEMQEKIEKAQKAGIVTLEDAKKEVAKRGGNYTHTFKAPIEVEGKKYDTMTFYYDTLTGNDIIAIEEEMTDQGKYVLTPEINTEFQTMLAARAAGVGSDTIRNLPLAEYLKIKNSARDFLMQTGY